MGRYSNHREKIERLIGRKLQPGEIIHHKDHNPSNNDLANLIIVDKIEHTIIHTKGLNAWYKYRKKQSEQEGKHY